MNSTIYKMCSFSLFFSLLVSLLMKFSMELMEPLSSVVSLEKLVALGLWLRVKERFFMQQHMPRLSSAVRLLSILDGIQGHHFRLSEYCKRQVQTCPKQWCPTWTGKQAVLQIDVNHHMINGEPSLKIIRNQIDEPPRKTHQLSRRNKS